MEKIDMKNAPQKRSIHKTYPTEAAGTVVRIRDVSIPIQVQLDLAVPHVQIRAVTTIRTMHGASHLSHLIRYTGLNARESNPEFHFGSYP